MNEIKTWLSVKDLTKADWFPLNSRQQVFKHINSKNLKAVLMNKGKTPEGNRYLINKEEALKFIAKLEDNKI